MIKQIVIGTLALAGVGLLIKNKVNKWREILPQLKAFPTEFKNLNINWERVTFDIDITIFNPTREAFNPDGIIAQLDRLEISTKGKKLATLQVKKSHISIPAEGKFLLKDLRVTVPIAQIGNIRGITSYDDIDVTAVMNVLGEEYTI